MATRNIMGNYMGTLMGGNNIPWETATSDWITSSGQTTCTPQKFTIKIPKAEQQDMAKEKENTKHLYEVVWFSAEDGTHGEIELVVAETEDKASLIYVQGRPDIDLAKVEVVVRQF